MNLIAKFYFLFFTIVCKQILTLYAFKQDNLNAENHKSSIKKESRLVHLEVTPKEIESHSSVEWKLKWRAVSTFVAYNSWIGTFLYGQKSGKKYLKKIKVKRKIKGSRFIKVPKEAGIYEIRYIQDNNYQTIATTGPLTVNPKNSKLLISKTHVNLEETVVVTWELSEELLNLVSNKATEAYLCLNILGAYDECIWTKNIEHALGYETVKFPKFAGYFIMRLMLKLETWKFLPESKCLIVSSILKASNPEYELQATTSSIVSSTTYTKWNIKKSDPLDWIGMYSLDTTEAFTRSANPIQSIKIDKKLIGEFKAFLPPNSPSGSYIFIYFSDHTPISVSEIINVQQPVVQCPKNKQTMSKIKHLVIICTENHSFDSYFGNYCTSPTGSNPKCTTGRECCEKIPSEINGNPPYVLNDNQNRMWDPNHNRECEHCQVNGGKMNGYVKGCYCSSRKNFAVAKFNKTLSILHKYAQKYSLADRYFQPNVGASAQNNMFFARASYVFDDNDKIPIGSVGSNCQFRQGNPSALSAYYDPSITSLLAKCGFVLRSYAEGYNHASKNYFRNPCYPKGYDASDIPFNYYAGITDNLKYISDLKKLESDIRNQKLPEVSFIKPLGFKTGHPGNTIREEVEFIKKTVEMILDSPYYEDTLIVWVPDESGGFYDHITPPPTSDVDKVPYGPRIPLLAIGKFAKKNYISHEIMEHSSIVKFIEWNWLSGKTGQLNTRDKYVNSIGDLIDPVKAGIKIPN